MASGGPEPGLFGGRTGMGPGGMGGGRTGRPQPRGASTQYRLRVSLGDAATLTAPARGCLAVLAYRMEKHGIRRP